MTYRLGGHSTSDDPSVYRSSDEVDDKLQTCPMKRLRLYLEKHKLWDQDQEDQALKQVKEETDKAICVARKTPPPKPATIIEDVYFEVPQKLKQQFNAIQGVY